MSLVRSPVRALDILRGDSLPMGGRSYFDSSIRK